MNEENDAPRSRVSVTFKKSSQKDGAEGCDIYVAEGLDEDEANRVLDIALRMRERAMAALKGPSLEVQLEKSLAAKQGDDSPPLSVAIDKAIESLNGAK